MIWRHAEAEPIDDQLGLRVIPRRYVSAAPAALIVALALCLLGCTPAEESPPPPSGPVEPVCPSLDELDAWGRDHPEGSIPNGLRVERLLWCTGFNGLPEEYRQLETDQVQPIRDALKLPSRPDRDGPCPAILETPYYLIAVSDTTAVRAFVPREGCGYHPEAERIIKDAPWRESATQPKQ